MITEDYVSFEVAKLLKEKGFNENTMYHYTNTNRLQHNIVHNQYRNSEMLNAFSAPTLQLVMKWLREIHKWTICISPYWAEGDMRNKLTWYYDIHSLIDNKSFRESSYTDSYAEACENAIKYCIKNLI